jgi:hypothetical protein
MGCSSAIIGGGCAIVSNYYCVFETIGGRAHVFSFKSIHVTFVCIGQIGTRSRPIAFCGGGGEYGYFNFFTNAGIAFFGWIVNFQTHLINARLFVNVRSIATG